MRKTVFVVTAMAAGLLAAAPVVAQETFDMTGRAQATRSELEGSARQLDDLVQASRDRERSAAHDRLTAIRARLAEGDFHAGDRIAIVVRTTVETITSAEMAVRPLEQQLTDTFTVGSRKELTLPVVGEVTLQGVLRSELGQRLRTEIARFVRDPVVDAWPLIRLSVQGAVARPGYYMLPLDAALADAVMAAGGPAPGAKISKLRVERDGKPLMSGASLQRAIAEGRTLAEMSLRPGDQLMLPESRAGAERALRTIGLALAIPAAIFTLLQR
jgi:protein involved in polysaccharide export with SLBB domain